MFECFEGDRPPNWKIKAIIGKPIDKGLFQLYKNGMLSILILVAKA